MLILCRYGGNLDGVCAQDAKRYRLRSAVEAAGGDELSNGPAALATYTCEVVPSSGSLFMTANRLIWGFRRFAGELEMLEGEAWRCG